MDTALAENTQPPSLVEQAQTIVVVDAESYARAGEFVAGCKALIAEITAAHKNTIDAAHKAHKEAIALRDRDVAPVEQAMKRVSGAALTWKREEDERARKKHQREEDERAKAAQEAKLKEAKTLERFGDTEGAEQAMRMAVMPARHVKFESPAPKVAGLATRKTWKARITAPSQVARQYCIPDQALLNRAVQQFMAWNRDATPEQIAKLQAEIGGVEVYCDEQFAGTGR